MSHLLLGSRWSIVARLVRNLAALALVWVVGFVFVKIGERALGGWPASEAGQLLADVVGVAIALRLGTPVVAYVAAAMVAYSTSELIVHLIYGLRAAQGVTHLAVLSAAVLGVAFGAMLAPRDGRGPASHLATAKPSLLAKAKRPILDGEESTSRERLMPLQPCAYETVEQV